MFLSINQTILNVMQIVSVVPEVHHYTARQLNYGSAPDTWNDHTTYKIHVNTINFRHDNPIDRTDHDDSQYEYTFFISDVDEWTETYNNICDALGVVGDIRDVRHNKI